MFVAGGATAAPNDDANAGREVMTEVILKDDVDNLGSAGEVVDVKPGYARNYLLPQGLALRATDGNLKRLQEEQRHRERAVEREREVAEELAAELEGRSITFHVQAGEEGKLFGSVTAQDLEDRLAEDGLTVDRRRIGLDEPIKELGVYNVDVDLYEDVQPVLKVWVVAEE